MPGLLSLCVFFSPHNGICNDFQIATFFFIQVLIVLLKVSCLVVHFPNWCDMMWCGPWGLPLSHTGIRSYRENTPSVYHGKDIPCGHLALMITEALRAIEAPGCLLKAVYLLIRSTVVTSNWNRTSIATKSVRCFSSVVQIKKGIKLYYICFVETLFGANNWTESTKCWLHSLR